ncbi:MAG: DinB family protein [Thermonemataceae bacterium]|nr:DinB family protein [Thermonemataceae bacterium]
MYFTAQLPNDEYPSYAQTYLSHLEKDDILAILKERLYFVKTFLADMSEANANFRYAPEKWSIKEILLHITDSERVFAYRALSFARGEQQSLPGFDQDVYLQNASAETRTLKSILQEFEVVRLASIALFENIPPKNLLIKGIANNATTTPRALAAMAAGHEIHHFKIITERYIPLLS